MNQHELNVTVYNGKLGKTTGKPTSKTHTQLIVSTEALPIRSTPPAVLGSNLLQVTKLQ